jgi:hypothetical protein
VKNFTKNMFSRVRNWFSKSSKDVDEETKSGFVSGVKNFFGGKKEKVEEESRTIVTDPYWMVEDQPKENIFKRAGSFLFPKKVEDGVFKFDLESSTPRGSLFDGNNPVIPDVEDDLFLIASTNPARDSLTESVDRLGELIVQLATAINSYRPQITNTVAPINNQDNILKSLLARG